MASLLKVVALTVGAVALVLWPTRPVTGWAATDDQTALPLASDLWLAPATDTPASRQPFGQAIEALNEDEPDRALPFFTKAASDPVLGGYALLYLGRTQLKLNREKDALSSARQLLSTSPAGHLGDAALWLSADASELLGDWAAVVRALQTLAASQPADPQRIQLRLGRAAVKVDDTKLATAAFNKVYYEYPLTVEADEARQELDKLNAPNPPAPPTPERLQLDLARAERLYNAGRYTDSRKAFDALRALVAGDERQLAELRLAQCDYQLKRYPQAHDALRAYIDKSKNRLQEAQFSFLNTLRQLGRKDEYLALVRAFVDGNPNQPFAEAALNELGTFYILENDDAKAAEVFAEMYRLFPHGVYAERAAWKAGWWAYKNGEYAETIRVFEAAAITFPRADYRPSWMYWTARARLAIWQRHAAQTRHDQACEQR